MQTKKQFTFIFIMALLLWSSIVGIMYITMVKQEEVKTKEIALSAARTSLIEDRIFRFWATSHGGLYVPITKKTQPNPALANIKERDLYLKDKNLTLMNPAYALRQMMNEYRGMYGLKGHITSLKLLNPDNAPDAWERKVLENMENGTPIKETYKFMIKDDKPVLRMLEPLKIKKGCLKCHSGQDYKIGELRGGVTVMLPMTHLNNKMNIEIKNLRVLYTVAWLFGLFLITYFYHKILQSISQQIKLTNELIDKEYFLRTLIDADSNLIITTYNQKTNLVNQAVLDFLGYKSVEEFKKEHVSICDFFIEKDNCILPEVDGKDWIEYILSNKNKNNSVCMNKNGKEHVFSLSVKKMDFVGEEQFVVVFNDITKLLYTQQNLAQAQHIAKVGHWDLNLLNNKFYWSDEIYNMFGIDKNKITPSYEYFMTIIHPEDRTLVDKTYKKSLKDKKESYMIYRIIVQDSNEEKIVEERWKHYFDKNGNIMRSLGTVQDITERKKLEQELQEKEEMMIAQSRHAAMGEMISMIAHQWRQPITVISMVANNLLADVELDVVESQGVKKGAMKVLEQSKHLSQTIDDFKNFFRPNKKRELVLVNDILEENFKIIGKSLDNNNILVEKRYESQTAIEIYSRELLQVFINILKNAKEALVEAKTKDAKIFVTTTEDKNSVYISICDNGDGIDKAIITKIYDPYFSTKDEKTGTGLGLYMTKTIIQKHLQGIIKVKNLKDGGVCFKISLPKKRLDNHE